MSLQISCSYIGHPCTRVSSLQVDSRNLLIYGCSDSVVVLDASSLTLVATLALWTAFPGLFGAGRTVTCVVADQESKIVIAASEAQLVLWSFGEGTWNVHSTLSVHFPVTAVHYRAGKLAVAGLSRLVYYDLKSDRDIPTWLLQWFIPLPTKARPVMLLFSPSSALIAVSSLNHNVHLVSAADGRLHQTIPHPRAVTDMSWRSTHRDHLILYTVTSDATLRIFLPVIDSPQHLQLQATIDPYTFLNSPLSGETGSAVFWLDREIMQSTMLSSLAAGLAQNEHSEGQRKRVEEICYDGWDLFARVLHDGSIVVRALANIDRRPPTLLKQFTLLRSHPRALRSVPNQLTVLAGQTHPLLVSWSSNALICTQLQHLPFFDARSEGLQILAEYPTYGPSDNVKIKRFVRTPEGKAVAIARENGDGELRMVNESMDALIRGQTWSCEGAMATFDGGHSVAYYSAVENALVVKRVDNPAVSMSIARLASLFSLPSSDGRTCLVGITSDSRIIRLHVSQSSPPVVTIASENTLPLARPPQYIVPVDPMAWSTHSRTTAGQDDILLSVSEDGELAFWTLEGSGWKCTGTVRTGRTGIVMANCSSAKKTVLVTALETGQEITIWDSKVSEFSSGLEYKHIYSSTERVNDLDWTSTTDSHSILAVGFDHHVVLLSEQRMTYFEQEPSWQMLGKVDVSALTPHPIVDSIWLTGGTLLIGAGHQMFYFGRQTEHIFDLVEKKNGPLVDYHPQMLLQCLLWEKIELVKDVIVRLAQSLKENNSVYDGLPFEDFSEHDEGATKDTSRRKGQYVFLFDEAHTPENEDDDKAFSKALVDRLIDKLESRQLPLLTTNEQAHLIILIQATLEVDEQRRSLDSNGLRYCISMDSFYLLNRRLDSPQNTPGAQAVRARQQGHRDRIRYRDIVWAFHSQSQEILLSNSTAACGGKMMWSDARALGIFLWLNSTEALKSQMEIIARNQYMSGEDRDPTTCCLFYFALGKMRLVHGLWKQAAWHREQSKMLDFLSNNFNEPRWRTAALKNAFKLLSIRRYEYAAAFFILGGSLLDAVTVCLKQLDDIQLAVALARVVEGGDDGPVLQGILKTTIIPLAFKEGNRWLSSWAFWMLRRRDLAVRILVTALDAMAQTLDPDMPVTDVGDPHYDDPSLALLFAQLKNKSLLTAKGASEISGQTEFNFVIQIAQVFCRMGCHALAVNLLKYWSFDRPVIAPPRWHPDPVGTAPFRIPANPQSEQPDIFDQMPSTPLTPRRARPSMFESRRRSSVIIDMNVLSDSFAAVDPSITSPTIETRRRTILEATKEEIPSASSTSLDKEVGDNSVGLDGGKTALGGLLQNAKRNVQVPEFDMNAFF